jgi:probable phosphoglycerate mutase
MLRIVLIQPGSTDFDEQGRIKGSLDLPLSLNGAGQAARAAQQLAGESFEAIYSSPNQSAMETANTIAENRKVRVRRLPKLRNLDHGLWHGKLIAEVKQNQPRIYRQGQDNPDSFCPPEGESLAAARQRAQLVLNKIIKKHKGGTVALVVPEPLASVVRGLLQAHAMDNVWNAEQDCGVWTLIEIPTGEVPVSS